MSKAQILPVNMVFPLKRKMEMTFCLSSAVYAREIIRTHLKSSPLSRALNYKNHFLVLNNSRTFVFYRYSAVLMKQCLTGKSVPSLWFYFLGVLVHHPSLHFNLSNQDLAVILPRMREHEDESKNKMDHVSVARQPWPMAAVQR